MKDDTQELTLFDNYDFIEKIESLMADCESAEVEFKSARGGFPGSLWETYSAFANTQGGVIVLGVKEKDGKFTLDGITLEQARKYKKEFWDNVNNKAHCSANVLQEKDVQDGEYNGSYVLVFNVPRAPRNKIPVYLHNNPENTFKRNYEGDFRCDASEIQRMFADADITEHPRDYKILPEFTIEQDIDKATLEQYRRLVATKSPDHPWLLLDDKHFLMKLKGYRIDRREKIEGLTLAGLLMFGKTDSITDAYGGRHQRGRNTDTYGSTRSIYQCTGPLRLFGRLEHYDRTTQGLLHILQSRFPAALHCPILSRRQQRMPQQGPANDVHADRFSGKGRKRCRQDHARLEKGKLPQPANRGDHSSRQSRIDIAPCQFVVR